MRCEKCTGQGAIDCIYCGGTTYYSNEEGEVVSCAACGLDGNPPGQLCCPDCNGSGQVN